MKIENFKSRITNLTTKEKIELIKYIKSSYSIFDEYVEVSECSHCNSKNIIKWGKTSTGVLRFKCKDCNKYFTYKTNTVLSGLQQTSLAKWNTFVEDFMSLNISSLTEITEKLDISRATAMNWRIKLLAAFSNKISNISFNKEAVEFDESYFLISRKGRQNLNIENKSAYRHWRDSQVGDSDYNVKVFFAYGRNSKQLELHQSHTGRTSTEDLEKYFVNNKFNDVTVYSDKHPSYRKFFNASESIKQETFLAKEHVNLLNNDIHNQTINAYTRGFKDFINKQMRGVSTKYLSYYAKWYEFITNAKSIVKKQLVNNNKKVKFNIVDKICNNVVTEFTGLELYRQSEYSFITFLKQNGRTNFGDCKTNYYSKKLYKLVA